MLPAIRLYRQGYPDYLPLGEFVRRFNVLVPPDALPASLLTGLNNSASEKQAAEILLLHIDLERTSYRVGLSQVSSFFFFSFYRFAVLFRNSAQPLPRFFRMRMLRPDVGIIRTLTDLTIYTYTKRDSLV